MKLLIIICVFGVIASIKGVPEDYEQWLQPRGISDLPFISWFYGGSTHDNHEENDDPDSPHRDIDETNPNELKLENNDLIEDKSADTSRLHDKPESIGNLLKELHEELKNFDKWKLEDVNDTKNDDQIRVIPVDEVGPNEKPEPIENLLQNLKQEVNETNEEEKKNIVTLLTDLNKTMKETSTSLAKVFINKTWHIFDLGALGTTRRTRNMEETITLLAPIYALLGLLSQLFGGLHLGGNNLLSGSHGANNIQGGGLLELLFPSLSSNSYLGTPADQKVLGGIAGFPGGHNHDSKNLYIICINDKNKEKANRMLNGKTTDEVTSKIEYFLKKPQPDTEEKFYIVWKLFELFDHLSKKGNLSEKNKENLLKIITLIILISEDPRFEQLFKIFKSKKEPEFDEIWQLFKNKPKLNEKYIMIVKQLPHEKIIEYPSRDCFVVDSDNKIIKKSDDSDSDDEETRSKNKKKSELETYLMKIAARDIKSKKDYYICCIDDDDELKANRILDGKTNGDVMNKINEKLKRDDLSTEYKWYIILRLYKMLKDIEKDEKDKKYKDEKEKEREKKDKDEIINLIIVIGKNPDFEPLFKNLKTKNDPRFREIWKLLKNEPREPEKEQKPIEKDKDPEVKDDKDRNVIQKNLSDIQQPSKEDKVIKEEKEPKIEHVISPQTVLPPQVHINQRIDDLKLPDIIKMNLPSWESQYDPIFKDIEIKINDPALDSHSKWKIIEFIDKWYLADFADPKVKSKADGLVNAIKQNPAFNETFDTIKRNNTADVTKRVFDLFGKEFKDPLVQHSYIERRTFTFPLHSSDSSSIQKDARPSSHYTYSTTPFDSYISYNWINNFKRPQDDYEYAKLPLVEKIDTIKTLYTLIYAPHVNLRDEINFISEANRKELMNKTDKIVNENRKEFYNFDSVFIPQVGGSAEFLIQKFGEFKDYLLQRDRSAERMIYSNGQERTRMQDFINEQKHKGLLPP